VRAEDLDFRVDSGVYAPAEDTYLLIDAIDLDRDDVFLDVGCGAGLLTLGAARIARRVVATDISLEAARNTLRNLERNGLEHPCSVMQSDLLGSIPPAALFSVIAFNPPYLPYDGTSTEMDHALLGGVKGTELTERFIQQAVPHLQRGGSVFVVSSSLANIKDLRNVMVNCGLHTEIVASVSIFFEKIQVLEGTQH
jgi:release factor glutamine methyltransferase